MTDGVKTFEYDHEEDGVHIHIRGEHDVYLSDNDLCALLKCLMVDGVKEIMSGNQDVANGLASLVGMTKCDKCDGKGVFK